MVGGMIYWQMALKAGAGEELHEVTLDIVIVVACSHMINSNVHFATLKESAVISTGQGFQVLYKDNVHFVTPTEAAVAATKRRLQSVNTKKSILALPRRQRLPLLDKDSRNLVAGNGKGCCI